MYIMEYTMALPVSLSIAGVFSQFKVNNWRAKLGSKVSLPQGFAYSLVLFLAASHRFELQSPIIVVWSALAGYVLMLITKGVCGKCKGKKK